MSYQAIQVHRKDISQSRAIVDVESRTLDDGEIRVVIDRLGLSANNVSYAAAGEMLGYWAHFSTDETWGVVPVWGFATVTESRAAEIPVGEQLFGFLPMASEHIFRPQAVDALCFADGAAPRANLHPWYTRLYRCAADPVFVPERADIQPLLWALFMTGWMMAEDLGDGVDSVYLSSASSKTALALGWALKHSDRRVPTVGMTSPGNLAFVERLGVYQRVVTYDEPQFASASERCAYVDFAGNSALTSQVHVGLAEKLVDSVLIGATHRAPSAEPLPMPGPSPRFFFIPDVAEAKADTLGFSTYHERFARVWRDFADWSSTWLRIEAAQGSVAIEEGYQTLLHGDVAPNTAKVYQWS
ncbi:MAG: DUF2855 family protein [Pseudomonadota bacterium]